MKLGLLLVTLLHLVSAKVPQATTENLGKWKVIGTTGASAMHLVVTTPNHVVILDKAERNPTAIIPGTKRTGWTTEYNLDTNIFRVLNLETNTFCSAGAFLGNGTLIETAGGQRNVRAKSGYSKIRMFTGCINDSCDWLEMERNMDSARWYNTMVTLPDGRTFTIGGSITALVVNTPEKNNPTYEFFPEVGQKQLDFLEETLPFNLYPAVHVLPDRPNTLFIFASTKSILFDYTTGQIIKRLPDIDHPRSYPLTGASVLLPLTYKNNYEPEILMCGGQSKMKMKKRALDSCGRLKLGGVDSKKEPKWEMEDFGGLPRVMPDSVILADGTVLFLNGAGVGYAGYIKRSGKWVADDPVKTPVLYDPNMPKGKRWTRLAPSEIARMYHSAASLLADGSVFVAGSNPNNDYNVTLKFPTEYRAERFTPPYLLTNKSRAKITKFDKATEEINTSPLPLAYAKNITISLSFNSTVTNPTFRASLIHFGFVTHSQHMSQRYVELRVSDVKPSESEPARDWQVTVETHKIEEDEKVEGAETHEWKMTFEHEEFQIKGEQFEFQGEESKHWQITVETPPNSNVLPPGPSYLFVLADGVPSEKAVWVKLGHDD